MRPSSADTSDPACTKRKMLSMNSSTSWPPWSRKYSAMVSPDSATRMRAPGGSFIWPNTSMVLSITPDSLISSQRSLPSRERSPTPQKADSPPCSCARLWISSWIRTVLPTPAPPNRPTLPPWAYGASRSTTLMPVSKISRVGVHAVVAGVLLPLEHELDGAVLLAPPLELDLERVVDLGQVLRREGHFHDDALHLLDGAGVGVAALLLLFLGLCCCFQWVSCLAEAPGSAGCARSLSESFCAGHHFHDLLGDLRLSLAIRLERQVVDDVGGVVRGAAHGAHTGAMLGRRRLEQRPIDRDLHVVGHEPGEDLLGVRLVDPERARVALRRLPLLLFLLAEHVRLLQRQQRLAADLLVDRGDVAVVDDLDAVHLVVDVRGGEVVGDRAGVGEGRPVGEARPAAADLQLAELERGEPAPARHVPEHLLAVGAQLRGAPVAGPDDLRVERAGQSAVAGHEQDADRPDALLLLQDRQAGDVLGGLRGARGHPPDGVRVRPQVLDPLLRTTQARGGDHLHGARDLADVLHRPDAAADVLQGGHLGGGRLLPLLRLGGLVARAAPIAP